MSVGLFMEFAFLEWLCFIERRLAAADSHREPPCRLRAAEAEMGNLLFHRLGVWIKTF